MVILIPIPREPAQNLAKALFKMLLVYAAISGFIMFIIGITSLIDGDITGGLTYLAVGLVVVIATSIWMYFRIKAAIERNERFFTTKSVVALAVSGLFITMIGIILLTYGDQYLTVGILVTVGSVGFLIPGIIRIIQNLKLRQDILNRTAKSEKIEEEE